MTATRHGEPTNWRLRAPCHRLPADWWETGDHGNRLAITLCRLACTVQPECRQGDPNPAGIVHNGVAYNDRGEPYPQCPCGRPIIRRAARPGFCWQCEPTHVHIRLRPPGRPRRHPSTEGSHP
jgi:hypothetical protein